MNIETGCCPICGQGFSAGQATFALQGHRVCGPCFGRATPAYAGTAPVGVTSAPGAGSVIHNYQSPTPACVGKLSLADKMIPSRNVPALIGYYMGIGSLLPIPLLGLGLGITALVAGIMGLRKVSRTPEVRGGIHAWVGIACGCVGLFLQMLLIMALVVWKMVPMRMM